MSVSRVVRASIKIPKYIERGPTDILKALASTVKHIPKEPKSIILDDPFLSPTRQNETRLFALSVLSGRKTAKFILNKHPELFYRDDAEPKVSAFLPSEEFRADMEFDEDDIKWCIENDDSVNGVIAYKSLEEKNSKLTDETLLQFFELLCFTNEEAELDLIDYESRRLTEDDRLNYMTWKKSGLASKIFDQIKETLDPPRVYSAMIAGLTKFNEHTRAKEVFDEFKDYHPDKALHCSAYSSLISSVAKLESSKESAHRAVDEIVKHMEENYIMPDLRLFNSILNCYHCFHVDEPVCKKSFQLINDMHTLGIQPSLGTFLELLTIMFKHKRGSKHTDYIEQILDHIDLAIRNDQIRDASDANFLHYTMNSIARNSTNFKLAKKLYNIMLKNSDKFRSFRTMNTFNNNYFKMMIATQPLENILKFYNDNVPVNLKPSPDTYEALLEVLDLYQADENTIKKIGQDIIALKLCGLIKNDAILRKDPEYVAGFDEAMFQNSNAEDNVVLN